MFWIYSSGLALCSLKTGKEHFQVIGPNRSSIEERKRDAPSNNTEHKRNKKSVPLIFRETFIRKGLHPVLCVHMGNDGSGFGNKVMRLVPWLALARATKRDIFVRGPGIVWERYWESNFGEKCPKRGAILKCEDRTFLTNKNCIDSLYVLPSSDIHLIISGNHELQANILSKLIINLPRLHSDYYNEILKEQPQSKLLLSVLPFTKEIWAAVEVPRIMYKPKPILKNAVKGFLMHHKINRVKISASIQVRVCVDCGWQISASMFNEGIRCIGNALRDRGLDNNSFVFVTSDTTKYNKNIQTHLGMRTVIATPISFIHTARSNAVKPYLDNYLLGESDIIASTWTSYGRVGAFRTGGLNKIESVIIMKSRYIQKSMFPSNESCHSMLEHFGLHKSV
jgi:hypothetical protein